MRKNMGNTDRLIRILISVVLVGLNLGGVLTGTLALVSWVLAGIFVLTSVVGFCPLYTLFGINTCQSKSVNP
jgi:esterase/lipase